MHADNSLPIQAEIANDYISLSSDIVVGNIPTDLDFRKSLFNLINAVNPKKYSVMTADFIKLAKAANHTGRNTSVLLVELPNLGLFNLKRVLYNRTHTSKLGVLNLLKGAAVNVSDLLVSINTALGITILREELQDAVLANADANGKVTFSLQFNDKSFRFYSDPEVVVSLPSEDSNKENLGISNIDNTPDSQKPMSIPQLNAAAAAKASMELYVASQVPTGIQKFINDPANSMAFSPVWSKLEW